MAVPSPAPIFAILRGLVEEHAGLHYALADQDIFLDRVRVRASEVGFESLLDYYYFLRYDSAGPAELEKLVEGLVVHETFFFREFEPLRLIVSDFVLPLLRAGVRPRIWSAACSTGEEPLTLAMLLADAGVLRDVEIIASDISSRALERAKAGQFGRRSLRQVPETTLASRWIEERPGGDGFTVSAHLREAIDWRRINLCDRASTSSIGPCDVILCRNVLIYFGEETLMGVLRNLSELLVAQGALFVGVSESLLRFGTFLHCEERNQVFFYRKRT